MTLNGTLEYLDSSCQSLTYLISDYSGRTKTRIDLVRDARTMNLTLFTDKELSCTILPTKQRASRPGSSLN